MFPGAERGNVAKLEKPKKKTIMAIEPSVVCPAVIFLCYLTRFPSEDSPSTW